MNCPSPPSSTYASMAPALIHTDLEHAYRLGTQRLEEWGVHTVVPVLGDLVRAGIGQRRNKAWPFISFTRPSTRLRMHAFGCSLRKRYRQRSRASEQASDEHGRWELVQHLARYHMPRTEIGQRCSDCGISATAYSPGWNGSAGSSTLGSGGPAGAADARLSRHEPHSSHYRLRLAAWSRRRTAGTRAELLTPPFGAQRTH